MADKFDDDMFDDAALEDLFASAKSDARMDPSAELLARVLESAETLQAEQRGAQQSADVAPRAEGGLFHAVLQALGGWPSVSGVAIAGAAGVWIGVSSGTALMQNTLGLDLYGQSAQTYLSDLDVSYALSLGVEEE
ncbi:hypothetical protein [Shimia sp. MMG029]|uniref:hypothetical protein n=1 Tax=Shimia sp. MMG029 TaxID=3021978 RepID=UPI0022FE14C2|nr:hypothetical protein [Shimia sp. MMG029]MDA5556296.1 hypothetical protein [Shimia sp. MMG029]